MSVSDCNPLPKSSSKIISMKHPRYIKGDNIHIVPGSWDTDTEAFEELLRLKPIFISNIESNFTSNKQFSKDAHQGCPCSKDCVKVRNKNIILTAHPQWARTSLSGSDLNSMRRWDSQWKNIAKSVQLSAIWKVSPKNNLISKWV